jgi:hypothetical protein
LGLQQSFGGPGGIAGYNIKLDEGPLAFGEILLEAEETGAHGPGGRGDVVLTWHVQDVDTSAQFNVERWIDGNFTVIAEVDGSQSTHMDAGLSPGRYRYRILARFPDGGTVYSNIVELNVVAGEAWLMFPNPIRSGEELFVEGKGGSTLEVYNLQGQLVQSGKVPATGGVMIDLPRGMYIVRLSGMATGLRLMVE